MLTFMMNVARMWRIEYMPWMDGWMDVCMTFYHSV